MEQILFKNVIKRGFWHRTIEWILEVTTDGIVMENGITGNITRLPYSELGDVVIMNEHSTGHGYHYTIRTGMYHSPIANYIGMNSWSGQQIGDILFLDKSGQPKMSWRNMVSPNGIVQLVKSELRRYN